MRPSVTANTATRSAVRCSCERARPIEGVMVEPRINVIVREMENISAAIATKMADGTEGFRRTANADRECVDDRFQAGRHCRHFRRDSRYRGRNTGVAGLRICSPGYAVARCVPGGRDRISARRVPPPSIFDWHVMSATALVHFTLSITYAGLLLSLVRGRRLQNQPKRSEKPERISSCSQGRIISSAASGRWRPSPAAPARSCRPRYHRLPGPKASAR